ncbi:hypothetical protein Hanom_Chr05g00442401 [Helianthus anomalus]
MVVEDGKDLLRRECRRKSMEAILVLDETKELTTNLLCVFHVYMHICKGLYKKKLKCRHLGFHVTCVGFF